MYYLSGNGELEHIGDVNKDGRGRGNPPFQRLRFAGLRENFADVPSSFWAAEVIGDLVMKRFIEGASARLLRTGPAK